MGTIRIFRNKETASLFICNMLIAIWPEIKMFGFATGGTPRLLYGCLIQAYQDGKISCKDISSINLDEFVGLSPDHPQSYGAYLTEVYRQLDVDMKNNRFPTCLVDSHDEIQKACLRLEKWIEERGPVTVWILGIGENAHLAFLEPDGTKKIRAKKARYHLENLSLSTKEVNKVDFNKAISAGLLTVKEGKYLIQLAFGSKKTWAVSASVLGPMTGWVPSSLLQDHSNWILAVDQEAGAGILEHLSENKIRPKDGDSGERFYEITSEAGIVHRVIISRDVNTADLGFSIPTRTLEEEKQDLR